MTIYTEILDCVSINFVNQLGIFVFYMSSKFVWFRIMVDGIAWQSYFKVSKLRSRISRKWTWLMMQAFSVDYRIVPVSEAISRSNPAKQNFLVTCHQIICLSTTQELLFFLCRGRYYLAQMAAKRKWGAHPISSQLAPVASCSWRKKRYTLAFFFCLNRSLPVACLSYLRNFGINIMCKFTGRF